MEQIQEEPGQEAHIIQIKDKLTLDDGINEDNTTLKLLPEVNLKEPEPDDAVFKWAEKNIGESPDTKVESLEEFRDMIFEKGECEPHRTDDSFLLRFLRARHFIVRMAHRLLVNFYTFREENPHFFFNVDFSKLVEIGESDIFSVPPYKDQDGRRMLFITIGNWNTAKFTTDQLFQAIIFLIQSAILEPVHQILGGICVLDVENLAAGQAWYLTPTIAKHILAVAYSSLPHRIQAVHIVNVSKIFDYAFSLLKPFLSDLMRERIFIHQDFESLHKHVSPKYLPKRYGGIHKDYSYNDWMNILKGNDSLIEALEASGYEGGREFIKNM